MIKVTLKNTLENQLPPKVIKLIRCGEATHHLFTAKALKARGEVTQYTHHTHTASKHTHRQHGPSM